MQRPVLVLALAAIAVATLSAQQPQQGVGQIPQATFRTGTRLVVFIDYRLPAQGIGQALGWLLGRPYAAWCTRRMTSDARAAFGTSETR